MIARKSALIIATYLFNGILSYVALYFITRYMLPENYGVVAFALGFVTLFTIFGRLGYNRAHIKNISEGKDIGRCNGTFLATKVGLVLLMSIIVLSAIFFWKGVLGRGFETTDHEIAIYIILTYWIFRLFAQSFVSTFNAKKEIAKSQLPLIFETIVRVLVTVYVALAGFGALALALTYVIGEAAYFLSTLYFFRRYPIKKPSKNYFKNYSKFAFPLIIVVTCSTIMTNIDKIFIQLFWSASEVGYYYAAFGLSRFINMFTIAIGTLLFPTYSTLHANNNIHGIRKLTYQSERYLSMLVFPMVFGLVILAEPATFILLSGWMPTVFILQILPFFVLLAALERPYQSQFIGMNRPKIARNRVLIMVCLNVILNIILIPSDIQSLGINFAGLGAKGAALSTALSYGAGLIYSRIMSWKLNKIIGNLKILLHAFSAGIMAIVLYWLNIIFPINRWFELLFLALIGLIIYLGILVIFKEFTKKDLYFYIDTLNIRKMVRYIYEEIRSK
jgi:O-antigen/teichoic acid export membrane protein